MGTRTLLLVRHGQYAPEDGGRLTETGRRQARHTARWLAQNLEGTRIDALWSSTLPRARETATIIANDMKAVRVRATRLLCEGMYSKVKGYPVPAKERTEDRARASVAFAKFFKTSRTDRLEIVVCHGTLIRYLVCRSLHVSVLRWTRMNSNHCAMTRILIRDTGAVRVAAYNETAHLPSDLIT
jgi:serine/threonine-protein phosphatase PGAM5